MPITLHSEPEARAEDIALIENAVDEFNMVVTGDRDYRPLRIFLRDEHGKVRGGITADLWGGWMHIRYLWVDEALRRQGYGAQLIRAVEDEARIYNCHNAHVETFSFQARPFYERLGYQVIAALEDYPPGHTHYVLRKALT